MGKTMQHIKDILMGNKNEIVEESWIRETKKRLKIMYKNPEKYKQEIRVAENKLKFHVQDITDSMK